VQQERKFDFVSKSALAGLFFFLIACRLAFAGNYVVAWGDNTYGETNVPAVATNVQAIATGYGFSLALKGDGTVIAWGRIATNVPVGLSNIVSIAAGTGQALALKNNGTLVSWGGIGRSGVAVTNVPIGLSNVVAIACGPDQNFALKSNGTIYAWGIGSTTNIPADLSNVVAITAGFSAVLAIKNDGTIWHSGSFTNQMDTFSNAVAGALVANGQGQGIVLLGDGTASVWNYLNLTIISNVIAVASACPDNQAGAVWALQRNGTLTGIGYSSSYLGQSNVWMNLSNVLAIASGYTHHLAIIGDSFPKPIEPMLNAGFSNGQFTISQPTSLGRSYRLEYKNSFSDDWQIFPPTPGNGSTQILADPNPPPLQRFYRVHVGQ
jgi:alpha-tubulin suppressor-like RCC1 family protein